jgi:hypothetical protein
MHILPKPNRKSQDNPDKSYLKRLVLIYVLFVIFFSGCNQSSPGSTPLATITNANDSLYQARAWQQVATLTSQLHSGDLLLRKGNDFTSESLAGLNRRDVTFSHCGLVSIENDSIFVYHALGGEFNPDQKIRRDLLSSFADPQTNRGIGLYRFMVGKDSLNEIVREAKTYYRAAIPFDMQFSLDTDDRLYCAEFIYKTIRKATKQGLVFNISQIGDFRFIGVDDLFLHPRCIQVQRITYK